MNTLSSRKHAFFMLEVLLSLLFVSVIGTAILYSSFSSQKSAIYDGKLYALPRARHEAAATAYSSITPQTITLLRDGNNITKTLSLNYGAYKLSPRITLSLCEERAMIATKEILYKVACHIECENMQGVTYYFLFSLPRDKKA